MYNTDGNLAALRQYEREQDELERADAMLRDARQNLSDDLYEAYLQGNQEVIDEVVDGLFTDEWAESAMRRALTDPDYDLAKDYRERLIEMLDEWCAELNDMRDIDRWYREFKL